MLWLQIALQIAVNNTIDNQLANEAATLINDQEHWEVKQMVKHVDALLVG